MTSLENVTKYMMALLTALVVTTLYAPIVMTIFFSFYKTRKGLVNWESFSYEPYTKLIFEKQILESLLNSLYVGSVTVVCSLVIGFYFANYYHTSRGKMKELLQFIIFLPFLLPPIITGLSLLIFFRELGLPRSLNTVVIGHTIFVLAIVFKIILNKLETLKSSLMESAYDLGASKLQAFWYVLLPNIKLSLIIAGLLAFTISLDETLITLFLIGNDTTWPIKLWAKMRVGFSKQVNASVTLILILTSFLVLLIATIVSRSEKRIMY